MGTDHTHGDISLGEVIRRLSNIEKSIDDQCEEQREERKETLEQLKGINAHLGTLNSKVATQERRIAEQSVQVKNLNREVFDRPRQLPIAPVIPPELADLVAQLKVAAGDNAPALTRKDARLLKTAVASAWAAGGAVLAAVWWMAQHLQVRP